MNTGWRTLALLAALCAPPFPVGAAQPTHDANANAKAKALPAAVRVVAEWALRSGDHAGLPYIVVDKAGAGVYMFDAAGLPQGAAPALLGLARGDETVPGIGTRELAAIRPEERTTPAGRFVARIGLTLHGEEILWIDYESAVALHPVSTGNPREQRLQRLASSKPADRRITYGCINVAAAFFQGVVAPAFRASGGIVYVLPETRAAQDVFGWGGARR